MKTKKRNQPKTEERPNTAMFRQACSAGEEFREYFEKMGKVAFKPYPNAGKIIEQARHNK